jgi:hypothetical protein
MVLRSLVVVFKTPCRRLRALGPVNGTAERDD